MDIFYKITAILLAAFLIWRMVGFIKQNPEAFTLDKINQGMMSMGILALILIAGIALLVMMLKA